MPDWAAQVADIVVDTVDAVRDRTVVPARAALRAVLLGIVGSASALALLLLLVVGGVRALAVVFEDDVWAAHAILGGIFLVAGALCWARSRL